MSFEGIGIKVEIGTDASPWGLGGWLATDGVITHYFYDVVSDSDLALFQTDLGTCEGQQTLEGLAILVALRNGMTSMIAGSSNFKCVVTILGL